jgi:hypothetical protein
MGVDGQEEKIPIILAASVSTFGSKQSRLGLPSPDVSIESSRADAEISFSGYIQLRGIPCAIAYHHRPRDFSASLRL